MLNEEEKRAINEIAAKNDLYKGDLIDISKEEAKIILNLIKKLQKENDADNYIPKEKIREKIKRLIQKLNESNDDRWEKDDNIYYDKIKCQIRILKELLEGDKNGKEIYEGDIVKSCFENGLGAENKCLIIYDEYLCAFMGQEIRTKQQYLFNEGNPSKKDKQLKYTEVIGNIYDNKELLGGQVV